VKRACIFVDGENFRHSLKRLFKDGEYSFRHSDYLPETDWHHFFESIANHFDCELLRTYWYVVEQIDPSPFIPYEWEEKAKVLGKWHRSRIQACTTDPERRAVLLELTRGIDAARKNIESRAQGWRTVQSSIEGNNDQLEFRRCGSIRYDCIRKKFGTEKGVDTQLTTDMIELADIYDAAIILSGDADYLPPVAAVKRKGKLVFSVSFLDQNGKQLPGGARRLSNAVDSRLDLNFEAVRTGLSIERITRPLELDGRSPQHEEDESED
jgi:uncharacterized LabA/DUF88 family protein